MRTITVKTEALLSALRRLVFATGSGKTFRCFGSNVKLSCAPKESGDGFALTAWAGNAEFVAGIDVGQALSTCCQSCDMVLPFKPLFAAVGALSDCESVSICEVEVEGSTSKQYGVSGELGRGSFKIQGPSYPERLAWMSIRRDATLTEQTVSSGVLRTICMKSMCSIAARNDGGRMEIDRVNLFRDGKSLVAVGTNGKSMATASVECEQNLTAQEFSIPGFSIKAVMRECMRDKDATVSLKTTMGPEAGWYSVLRVGDFTTVMGHRYATFPRYKEVMPKEPHAADLTFSRDVLVRNINSIGTFMLAVPELQSHGILFEAEKDGLFCVLSCKQCTMSAPVLKSEFNPSIASAKTLLSPKLLLPWLKVQTEDEIVLRISTDARRPSMFLAGENRLVVMQMIQQRKDDDD